jgi:glyoxylase-like metal-dependent hydrolase (beta-lactamase superfamily II)
MTPDHAPGHPHDHDHARGDDLVEGAARPRKQEQEEATLEIQEVAPGILRLQLPISLPGLGHVNTYALEDGDGFTLVDPGLPGEESWKALMSRMEAAGIPMHRVHPVIVTHSPPDPFGGAGMLAEESGARVVASSHFRLGFDPRDDGGEPELEVRDLNDPDLDDEEFANRFRMPSPWGGDGGRLVGEERRIVIERQRELFSWFRHPNPSVHVDDSDRLTLGNREWMGVYTPGHTNDHLCLFDPEGGVLLSGDHVLPTITPHISGLIEGDPLRAYLDSLDRVAAFEGVTLVLPAHGHPFTDLPGRVDAIKEHHAERLEALRVASHDRGWASVNELMRDLFKERSWSHMAESETYAHLEHLRLLGEAERREDAGLALYLVP